jgi:DNA-binding transcriptional LysR family regulator
MGNQLDLRDLRYFEVIAETGHLGRAAKKLFRTQPALTSCIRRLEETLETPLFERVGRGIRLTPAGEALLSRARSLRVASEDTVREIGELGRGVAGTVRVGTVPTMARFLLPPVVRELLKAAPGVTIKTLIAQSDVLRNGLRTGELDLMVSFAPHSGEVDLAHHEILEDEVVVVASRSHPVHKRRARMKDLLDYGWALASSSVPTRQWIDHAFTSRGMRAPTVQVETNILLLLPPLIEQNQLLSFLSRRHTGRGATLREVPLKETTMRRKFAVTYRRDSYLSPAAKRFVDLLRERAEELFEGN